MGGSYGRRLMQGLLKSNKIQASHKRIAQSMKRVAPNYHFNRTMGVQAQVRPQRYRAPHFGYNAHFDQGRVADGS